MRGSTLIVFFGAFGLMLILSHLVLMRRLYSRHPEVWSELGGRMFPAREWALSRWIPFWSLKSIVFFLAVRYHRIDDVTFVRFATLFRLAVIVYLVSFFISEWFFFYR